MTRKIDQQLASVRLHLTNVAGAGATQLLLSLLPALERSRGTIIENIYLPDRGGLVDFRPSHPSIRVEKLRRYLPNVISRVLECTVFGYQFNSNTPLLVLGDIPLRCHTSQTVFVQTPHLLRPKRIRVNYSALKFAISRGIFRLNLQRAHSFVVQTSLMRDELIATYPRVKGKVFVIPQPVPTWLLETKLVRRKRVSADNALTLVYPAASYPHKNHKLLAGIAAGSCSAWPVSRLTLTLDNFLNPAPDVSWIECVGFLSPAGMINTYASADALLFLSKEESYGFPLVEAMFIGLPIIAPDLPYARVLCGDQAIYFDADDLNSLHDAVRQLHQRLGTGWWPDWSSQLATIPKDWDSVAEKMLDVVLQR